jgi:hypothetical protein
MNGVQNVGKISVDFIVPEPEHQETVLAKQKPVALLVVDDLVIVAVPAAIDLNDKPALKADKVDDVA